MGSEHKSFKMIKVTFSILCYNYGRYLQKAIDSCLMQGLEGVECEILVIDDGSTDNTQQVCEQYGHKIKVINEGNKGFGASLTRAVAYASGDYIFFLDADDFFAENKLATVLPYLTDGCDYVCDSSTYVDEKEGIVGYNAGSNTSTVAVRKKSVLKLLPVENELYFFPLFKLGRGKMLPVSCTYYRFHDNNMTNRNVPGKWQNYLAGVNWNLSKRLYGLSREGVEEWKVSKRKIRDISYEFKKQSYYHKVEAALELHNLCDSFKFLACMLYYSVVSRTALNVFNLKIFGKVLLQRPSFPKD